MKNKYSTSQLKYTNELQVGNLVSVDGYMVIIDGIKHFSERNCTQIFFKGEYCAGESYSFNDNYPVKVYY